MKRVQSPRARLVALFALWKAILLLVACASPGPGYDTSTHILFSSPGSQPSSTTSWLARTIQHATLRLTRWDGIYFSTTSARGHLYEQEWAFSWLFARLTSATAEAVLAPLPVSSIARHALAGIVLSTINHFFAVLILYNLIYALVPASPVRKQQLALTTAVLHIISPAGIFLSASSAESSFALFNFVGIWAYISATRLRLTPGKSSLAKECSLTILAGTAFALAAAMRGNGILSGILFARDAFQHLFKLPHTLTHQTELLRLTSTVLAGIILALGFTGPQVVAYLHYCTGNVEPRPWCTAIPPSIYSFVQSHYWNVGFLRYWTPGNIPLFLLAGPMATIMALSAYSALKSSHQIANLATDESLETKSDAVQKDRTAERAAFTSILPLLAASELILVVLAVTSFHVQIINRISSGYPVWYFILAIAVSDQPLTKKDPRQNILWFMRRPEVLVRTMIGYALVQGGLYASFLPPA